MTRHGETTTAAPASDARTPVPADASAAFRRLHHEHVAELLADLAAPPTDRALAYVFYGGGNAGKTATANAMAAATGRQIVPLTGHLLRTNRNDDGYLFHHPTRFIVRYFASEDYSIGPTGLNVVARLLNIPGLILVWEEQHAVPHELNIVNNAWLKCLQFGPISGADAAAIARDYFPDAEDVELAELAAAVDTAANVLGGKISAMCRRRQALREVVATITAGER